MAQCRSNSRSIMTERNGQVNKQSGRSTRANSSNQDTLSMDDKLDLLLKDVGQIKDSNVKFLSDISEIKTELSTFKEDVNKALDMCFKNVEECTKATKDNAASISTCEETVDNLRGENISLKRTVSDLRKKAAAAEQYSRSNCLEIQGVPESARENVMFVVKRVATALNFKLEDHMVDAVHRLAKNPNKPDEPRGIILKFCRRIDLEEMRRCSRVKRAIYASELGYQGDRRIYINMSLTRETRALWAEVQQLRKREAFQYSWITSSGKIFVRKSEGEAAELITEAADLDHFK